MNMNMMIRICWDYWNWNHFEAFLGPLYSSEAEDLDWNLQSMPCRVQDQIVFLCLDTSVTFTMDGLEARWVRWARWMILVIPWGVERYLAGRTWKDGGTKETWMTMSKASKKPSFLSIKMRRIDKTWHKTNSQTAQIANLEQHPGLGAPVEKWAVGSPKATWRCVTLRHSLVIICEVEGHWRILKVWRQWIQYFHLHHILCPVRNVRMCDYLRMLCMFNHPDDTHV